MKIETMTIDGKPALVAYLDDNFKPVEVEAATQAKVMFNDGSVSFFRKTKEKPTAK